LAIPARNIVRPCVPGSIIAAVTLVFRDLLATHFEAIPAFPLETLASSRAGYDAFGLPDFLGAVLAELPADILGKLTGPFCRDIAEIPVHPRRAQRLIPIRVHARRDDLKFVPTEMSAQTASPAAEVRAAVHAEAVDGKRPADALADIPVNGAATEDTARVNPVMRDVPCISKKDRVLGDREAIRLDVISEIRVADK
jgi:hypothetical protein